MLEGEGRRVFAEGDAYDGQFEGSRRHGGGTLRSFNGDEYSGEWLRDLRHGQGTLRMANGDVLEGSWERDLPSGVARLSCADGSVYEGQWALARPHGEGALWWANGDVVRGSFTCGLPSGRGVLELSGGARYDGALQPYASQAATRSVPGCNPMCPRLQPYPMSMSMYQVRGRPLAGAAAWYGRAERVRRAARGELRQWTAVGR